VRVLSELGFGSACAASGLVGLRERVADRPDGDVVEVEPVGVPGLERLKYPS
jgi:hypothetical protein